MDITPSKSFSRIELPPALKSSSHSMIEAVLLLVVIGLFYWFVLQPKQEFYSQQKVQLAELKDEQATLSSNLEKLKAMVKKVNASSEQIVFMDEALPLDGKINRLYMLLEGLAKYSGAVVGDVSLVGAEDSMTAGNRERVQNPYSAQRTLKKITGSVYVTGTFDQLEAFVKKVETNARIINILSLEMNAAADDKLSLKCSVEAYYYE